MFEDTQTLIALGFFGGIIVVTVGVFGFLLTRKLRK